MIYTSIEKIGSNILERYIDDDGIPHLRKVKYEPTLFVHCQQESKYTDIYGEYCMPKKFNSMPDANSYLNETRQYHEVLGMEDFVMSYIADTYPIREFNINQIRIANVDIETPSVAFPDPVLAEAEITSIGHYDNIDDVFYVFGVASNTEWSREQSIVDKDVLDKVQYIKCVNEKALLIKYLQHWRENFPDVVTGWNIETFDMPYIANRISKVLGDKALSALSPWNNVRLSKKIDDYGKETIKVNILGVSELDYLALYKKFTFVTRPTYKLDYIGEVELGEKKVEFEYDNYLDFYQQDYQTFIDYQIQDVNLVKRLDDKIQLLMLAISVSYYAGINFQTVFGTIKPWDAIIFNSLKTQNKVIPMMTRKEGQKFMGAYVKAPQVGYHRNIGSFDLTSLYPSIIRECNISPETIIGQLQYSGTLDARIDDIVSGEIEFDKNDISNSANGMQYRKDVRGVIPIEIEKVFFQRKEAKNLASEHQKNVIAAENEMRKRGLL